MEDSLLVSIVALVASVSAAVAVSHDGRSEKRNRSQTYTIRNNSWQGEFQLGI